MPSHQYPTGIVTSIGRRYELLGWACEEQGRYLIEDDYDCEFRLQGKAIPSLESIDAAGRVIYANTFAKSLGPAFRVGYMVLPEALAMRFRDEFGFYSNTVSAVDQLALARFIESGSYERHVNRMRTHYRGVRDAFVAAARMCSFSDGMSIEQADEGCISSWASPSASGRIVDGEGGSSRLRLKRGSHFRPVFVLPRRRVPGGLGPRSLSLRGLHRRSR